MKEEGFGEVELMAGGLNRAMKRRREEREEVRERQAGNNTKDEMDSSEASRGEGKRDLVVRSGRISDGVMPYEANGLYSLRTWLSDGV